MKNPTNTLEKAIAAVTKLGFERWRIAAEEDPDYLEALEGNLFYPDFPTEAPAFSSAIEPFINVKIGRDIYLKNITKLWAELSDRDACEAEVEKLRSALWQVAIGWIREARETIDCDEFATTYKGCDIYLMIPNGGILGAGFVVPDNADGWAFESETRNADLYANEQWHIARCQEKIDELFPDVSKQIAIGRCPMLALVPEEMPC